jgi:hypothetical protein
MDTDGREFSEGKNEEDEWADFLTTAEGEEMESVFIRG